MKNHIQDKLEAMMDATFGTREAREAEKNPPKR